jgi:sterol desaturase/sphingolipid hydroxylase (fatty acid hydroxylase superfamily)
MILAITLTAVLTFLLVEGVAYSVHRLAHSPKSGKLFRDHLHHHAQAYPPSRYQTEKYLGDLKTSFLPVFVPLFVLLNFVAAAVLPWPCFGVFFVVSSFFSLANNYLHDSFHVTGHWLRNFGWHKRLTVTHQVHHHNVKKNLGIYWYGLDRLFGSFRPSSNL